MRACHVRSGVETWCEQAWQPTGCMQSWPQSIQACWQPGLACYVAGSIWLLSWEGSRALPVPSSRLFLPIWALANVSSCSAACSSTCLLAWWARAGLREIFYKLVLKLEIASALQLEQNSWAELIEIQVERRLQYCPSTHCGAWIWPWTPMCCVRVDCLCARGPYLLRSEGCCFVWVCVGSSLSLSEPMC